MSAVSKACQQLVKSVIFTQRCLNDVYKIMYTASSRHGTEGGEGGSAGVAGGGAVAGVAGAAAGVAGEGGGGGSGVPAKRGRKKKEQPFVEALDKKTSPGVGGMAEREEEDASAPERKKKREDKGLGVGVGGGEEEEERRREKSSRKFKSKGQWWDEEVEAHLKKDASALRYTRSLRPHTLLYGTLVAEGLIH